MLTLGYIQGRRPELDLDSGVSLDLKRGHRGRLRMDIQGYFEAENRVGIIIQKNTVSNLGTSHGPTFQFHSPVFAMLELC